MNTVAKKLSKPAFSMQPPSNTFTVVGYANPEIIQLHDKYHALIIEAGKIFTTFSEPIKVASVESFNAYHTLCEDIQQLHHKILAEAVKLTGYTHVFFLSIIDPSGRWPLAVMNNKLSQRVVSDDPAAW